jgi:hypothetical protein
LPSSPSRPLFSVAQQFSLFFFSLPFLGHSLLFYLHVLGFVPFDRPTINQARVPSRVFRTHNPFALLSLRISSFSSPQVRPLQVHSRSFLSLAPTFLLTPRQDPCFAFTISSESRTSFVLSSGIKPLSTLSRPSRARVLFRDRSPPRESALPDLLLGLPGLALSHSPLRPSRSFLCWSCRRHTSALASHLTSVCLYAATKFVLVWTSPCHRYDLLTI